MMDKSFFSVTAAIVFTAACSTPSTRQKDSSIVPQISASGSFHIVYGAVERYFLIQDSSTASIELRFRTGSGESNPVITFDRRRVSVRGSFIAGDGRILLVDRISLLEKQ